MKNKENSKLAKNALNDVLAHQSRMRSHKPIIPSTTFTLTWKNVDKELPKEGGRYWCIVREVNDLGTSYYQWNCAYDPEATWTGKWSSNALRKDVIWWTELAPRPF